MLQSLLKRKQSKSRSTCLLASFRASQKENIVFLSFRSLLSFQSNNILKKEYILAAGFSEWI